MPSEERTFKVLARCAGREPGDTVDEAQLENCNVDALVEGGFLQEVGGASPETTAASVAAPVAPPNPPTSPPTQHEE